MKNLNNYKIFLRPSGRFFSVMSGLFCLLILSSCGKKNSSMVSEKSNKYVLYKNNQALSEEIKLKQAKYFDLPLPVGYNFVEFKDFSGVSPSDPKKQNTDFFCYAGDFDSEHVLDFYRLNMERDGWIVSDLSTQQEALLACNKSNKQCVISIRNDDDVCRAFSKKSCVCVFIKNTNNFLKDSDSRDLNYKNISDV